MNLLLRLVPPAARGLARAGALAAVVACLTACSHTSQPAGTAPKASPHPTTEGAYPPREQDYHAIENTERFVLTSKTMEEKVTCAGLREVRLADGRLQASANVRNRSAHRLEVQIDCAFKDEAGFVIDEVPFQTLVLTERAQETVTFTSMNARAHRFTMRVRSVR